MDKKKRKEVFKQYHSEMKTVNEAYIAGFLSYEEWFMKLKQLIEKLENNYREENREWEH